jgi:hypothetical protein
VSLPETTLENHRPESTDERIEHHSLPGTNMAGKKAANDCEPGEQDSSSGKDDNAPRQPDDSEREAAPRTGK